MSFIPTYKTNYSLLQPKVYQLDIYGLLHLFIHTIPNMFYDFATPSFGGITEVRL